MELTNFDMDRFLADYWQKKPLLIRGGLANWNNPLEPDLLAGLACEEGVESRLVVQAGDTLKAEHGPLSPERFAGLGTDAGDAPWTLLVQAVDQHDPDVAALIEPFRFIPDWRIDDVMVSYANDGGGVGAHFDNYDVFLVQGLGRRRWRVGQMCTGATALKPHDDLRLLAEFEAADEWVLEPGDILYVPPGIAHEGTAVGTDCMTYSIGFRAPAASELLADYCDHLLEDMGEDERYSDPGLTAQSSPGEITDAALAQLHAMVTERLQDREQFKRWFGEFASTPKYGAPDDASYDSTLLLSAVDMGAAVIRNPASRFVFIRRDNGALTLFADGRSYTCTGQSALFAEHICDAGQAPIEPALAADEASCALFDALLQHGSLVIEDEGE